MNELTEHYDIPKPNSAHDVRDDVAPLQQAFDIIDAALHLISVAVGSKAAAVHSHEMAAVTGLVDALAGKMASNRTFDLAELTDVVGADDALNNYILTKLDGVFVFASALSVLGTHPHAIADVTGLATALSDLDTAIGALVAEVGTKAAAAALADYLKRDGSNAMSSILKLAAASGGTASFNIPQSDSTIAPNVGDGCLTAVGAFLNIAGVIRQLVTTSGAMTMTGPKTLVEAILRGFAEVVPAAITGTAITPDLSTGTLFRLITTGNPTITFPTAVAGRSFGIEIEYGGAHTPSYAGGARKWPDSAVMEPTAVTGKKDFLWMTCFNASDGWVISYSQNY